ncbi:beta-glucosidase [Kineosphaera limosa]|uniref:Exo-alpha-(1->6)-L-arabinopyranosidase n=1 Tax=Kineosphaera limosa NBRC 100340 TaxID=1184609 RepID=K6W766_9MICO|nr:glycoside hydrolase family 3 N-terminal domain-containing protein [Kineosphaera limosa]NYE00499.1 beta-glucosidase [Kineosphaera limosa]GAB95035.1 periplasmic beta-glucosidase [Kineosphaera limosa NBRC 100340]
MTQAYRDPSLSVQERVADLLGRLTLEEKAGQLTQYFYFGAFAQSMEDATDLGAQAIDKETFLEQPKAVEAALATGGAGSLLFVKDPVNTNRLQRLAIEGNRHGIPVIFGFDVIHGLRTILPVPIALAASWDPDTIERGQAVAAREARAVGIHWTFAPMVDIAQDPRWGRIIEGAGEDPVLGAAVAAAQVRGFQGAQLGDDPDRVVAGPKHMAGYGASRGGRDYDDSDISDADLWNVYLSPFRAAVEAGAGNIMGAYMELNGVPASGNRWLLTDVLRGEFGFDGWVVSDANAVKSMVVQHFCRDLTDAGARAVHAGLDMEMAMDDPAYGHLPEAVAQGLVTEAEVDEAVRRMLTAKFRLGLFENPYVDEAACAGVLDAPEHREVARVAAERCAVLLKNDGILPLDAGQGSIAVIGALADSQRDTLGPWIFEHDVEETVTILAGIRERVGEGVTVDYAPGVWAPERVFASMFDAMDATTRPAPTDIDEQGEFDRAVAVAAAADVAVVVVGQPQNQIGEAASTSHLRLPGRQLELLQAVHATGTPVVVLVMSGRPLDLRWAAEHAPGILQVWYPGSQGGAAVASLLFGDVSPAGRLPFTWPRTGGQVPLVYNHHRTFQPENQDKRYWDEESTPLYPFGHGLTYSTVEYSELTVDRRQLAVGDTATVSVTVRNAGDRDVDEVVQLYTHQRYGTSARPIRELKGFARVALPAGASQTVRFELGPDQLRYWSAVPRDWVQDATVLDIWVGGSSAADLHTELEVVSQH